MICPKCGAEVLKTQKFCVYCGEKIVFSETEPNTSPKIFATDDFYKEVKTSRSSQASSGYDFFNDGNAKANSTRQKGDDFFNEGKSNINSSIPTGTNFFYSENHQNVRPKSQNKNRRRGRVIAIVIIVAITMFISYAINFVDAREIGGDWGGNHINRAEMEQKAMMAAKKHLRFNTFSYLGLIDQLEFEEYTRDEARYGADNCGADWNEQAVKAAKNYRTENNSSDEEVLKQLLKDKFTDSEAAYGVRESRYQSQADIS